MEGRGEGGDTGERKWDSEMECGHLDAKSQICASLRCFRFVSSSSSSSTFPPSSISCGDLSFPAGPMLISYWSSGFRAAVCEMGEGGERRGC